jgi:hypothetical protein
MTGDLKRHEVFYVGSGAPVTGDEITANNSAYPIGTHYLDSTNGTSYVRTGVGKVTGDWTSLGGSSDVGYLSYVALLTQTGTSAPVATVLDNTLGGSVVWVRGSQGIYTATCNGQLFDETKTILIVGSNYNFYNIFYNQLNGTLQLETYSNGISVADEQLNMTAVKIRVYP